MYLPIGLFGVSIAVATLPVVSRHAAREELDGIRDAVSRALRLMLAVNVPATVGLIVLGAPIVALLLERGAFTPADTEATAAALLFYAPGLAGYSAVRIAVPCFYALGSSLTPACVGVGAVALNVVLNLVLVEIMGYRGLALGTSIVALANAVTLLALLRRRLHGLDLPRVLLVFGKIALASAAMGAAAWMTHERLLHAGDGAGFVIRLGQVAASIAAGVLVLGVAARILRVRELEQIARQVTARLGAGRPREAVAGRAERRNGTMGAMRPMYHGGGHYSFGPGLMTPAVKMLLWANVGVFLLTALAPPLFYWVTGIFGLTPRVVLTRFWIWQPVTYMFVHGGMGHVLLNMLVLWMFGVQLERLWGSRFFLRYYFLTGIGAGLSTIAVSLLPFAFADPTYTAGDDRRLRRNLRAPDGVRPVLPRNAHSDVLPLPGPREVLRDDHRRGRFPVRAPRRGGWRTSRISAGW